MNVSKMALVALAIAVLPAFGQTASAQFFQGAPTVTFSNSLGLPFATTPAVSLNQGLHQIDVNGHLTLDNATPTVQTVYMTVTAQLNPAFNGGLPLNNFALQIVQSGYVDVPANIGRIYGWSIAANADNQGSVSTPQPAFPLQFGPGANQLYSGTTVGPAFTYTPSSGTFSLTFGSDFDGLTSQNRYVWDFPLSARLDQRSLLVPEPTSVIGLTTALAFLGRRRCR